LVLTGGCAHGFVDEAPTSPTPTTAVTIQRLTVTPIGGGSIIAGLSAPITTSGTSLGIGAWAQYSDGSAKYVAATWTSSDTGIITVDGDNLRAIGRGTATLTARAEGLSDSEDFTVEPDMAGAWSGSLVVEQCSAGSGSMTELACLNVPGRQPGTFAVGAALPLGFQIQKSGQDLTATATMGSVTGSLRGSDRGGNYLTLGGDLRFDRTTVKVVYWDTHVNTDTMAGTIGFEVYIDTIPTHANVVGHLENVKRR
jgi:hypothetical protein